jgi:hypothetical protein
MIPLADLIREALKGERLYTVRGNSWYGWWTGRLPEERQVFVAFGIRGGVNKPRWGATDNSRITDANAPGPALYLAVFDLAGQLQEVLTRPDPIQINPRANAPYGGVYLEFLPFELEAFLAAEFGGFERAAIRVLPFAIPEIHVELRPLLSTHAAFLDDPDDYDEEEQQSIRAWIEEGSSELLYGDDYFLNGEGEVTSN